MWGLVRTAAVAVFGDDVVKVVLYVVVGFLVFGFVESTAAIGAITAQPWGSWWLAGVSGGVQAAGPASGPVASSPQPPVGPVAVPVPTLAPATDSAAVARLIAAATGWLKTPYLWGGCARQGIDCSCFVQKSLAAIGISAPRVTTDQIRWATPVSVDQARAGDLVFFDNTCTGCGNNPTHVGLVIGGGRMIDAGDPVKIEPIYSGHNARYGRPVGL